MRVGFSLSGDSNSSIVTLGTSQSLNLSLGSHECLLVLVLLVGSSKHRVRLHHILRLSLLGCIVSILQLE